MINFLLSDDNVLQAVTGQQPFEIGSLAVESALKVLRGEPVEKKVAMPGVRLSRAEKDGVVAFQKRLQELISQGTK